MHRAHNLLFEILTRQNHAVRLYRDRYEKHILARHPEIATLHAPATEIESALLNAVAVRRSKTATGFVYIGPKLSQSGFFGDRAFYVYVEPERNDPGFWWVSTAVLRKAGAEDL